jgi:hypothetical protein
MFITIQIIIVMRLINTLTEEHLKIYLSVYGINILYVGTKSYYIKKNLCANEQHILTWPANLVHSSTSTQSLCSFNMWPLGH